MIRERIRNQGTFVEKPWNTLPPQLSIDKLSNRCFEIQDLFGEQPDTYLLHAGDLSVPSDWRVGDEDAYRYFVIDGDLVVDGVLAMAIADLFNVVIVTGNLKAKALFVAEECQLYVLGNAELHGALVSELGDSGYLAVNGKLKARAVIDIGRRGEKSLSDYDGERLGASDLVERFKDRPPQAAIIEALRTNDKLVSR
jgi:hypothetical protein